MTTSSELIEIDENNNITFEQGNTINLTEIPFFSGTYNEFLHKFLETNTPCLIPNVTKNWKCISWIENDAPNFEYLESKYGDATVPVANCDEKYYNAQCKNNIKFREFLQYWNSFIKSGYPSTEPCLYLKDWHFTKEFPEENVYVVPPEFSNDWLNEYHANHEELDDDYRFVYMGPKGSWTPFHADVFTSYSWSVNICGEKKWILLPPGEENKLKDKFGQLPYDFMNTDCNNNVNVKYFTVIQKPRDAIFVPSGWHHQVWNTKDTISINHNWINACSIGRMWLSMKNNLRDVKTEIASFQDSMENWEEHCQLILKSCFGMDFTDFYRFIRHIFETRKRYLERDNVLTVFGGWKICSSLLKYDHLHVQEMLNTFKDDTDVQSLLSGKYVNALIR